MEVFTTNSAAETKKLAGQILKRLKTNTIGLIGDLGSGKTTFTQGLAGALGIKERVISPSFMLVRQYEIRDRQYAKRNTRYVNLYHVDLYRLEGEIDVSQLGLPEIWENQDNLVIIEWAEKIKDQLPKNCLVIEFENLGGDKRKLKMTN